MYRRVCIALQVMYSRLFDWLVGRINASIGQDPQAYASIGLLDIYGFESFAFNDLEQVRGGGLLLLLGGGGQGGLHWAVRDLLRELLVERLGAVDGGMLFLVVVLVYVWKRRGGAAEQMLVVVVVCCCWRWWWWCL
jgi:hypothetical protein